MQTTIQPSDKQWRAFERELTALLKDLKPTICDDYRATDDPDDNLPGMCVTVGATIQDDGTISWSYQTGDNSYSGGAYGHSSWGIGYLYRRSSCASVAADIASDLANNL